MADNKKSFILYCDLIHTTEYLSDEDAGKVFKWVLDYVNDKNPEPLDGLLAAVCEPIKQQLKRDLKKYEKLCKKNSDNARKRWNKKDTTASVRIPNDAKNADNGNDTETDNDTVTDINKNIPSFEDFKNYAIENSERRKIDLDLDKLNLKYESWKVNNWTDGNDVPIKNWKSKLLNTIPYLKKEKSSDKKETPHIDNRS